MEKKQTNKSWGVASLVLGIIGLISFFAPYLGLPLSILAVISANKQNKINPTGNAEAGKVLGIIGIVVNTVMLFLIFFAIAVFGWAMFI